MRIAYPLVLAGALVVVPSCPPPERQEQRGDDDTGDDDTWYDDDADCSIHDDLDGDGYGDPDAWSYWCESVGVDNGDDCDDTNPNIHPGASEVCNGLDDDCDEQVDEGVDPDLDEDGWNECQGDCDNLDGAVFPGANEICNGVDDDCDPATDELVDDDGDGQAECDGDCDDVDPLIFVGAVEECDDIDHDCDGAPTNGLEFLSWYLDGDGDGHGNPGVVEDTCDGPPDSSWVSLGDDCDDANPDISPGASEVPGDGIDNDCDGVVE